MKKLIGSLLLIVCCSVQAHIPAWTAGSTAASTATGGFYATGSAEHSITEQSSTTTGQEYQGSNFNIGGNANIKANNEVNIVGSGVNVGNTLTLDAEKVNLRAGEEHHSSASSQRTATAGISGSTSGSGSLSANASHNKNESESHTLTHANSQISAGNLNSDSQSFTLAGANVEIANDINLNTQHLTVDSVQDSHHSSSKGSSQSVGVTAGGGSINPSSAGYGQNSSSEDSQWVNNQTTLIGGGKVNINADKTTVTGAVIANASRDENGNLQDRGGMNLVTNELIINDLQDHNRTDSKGINLSAGLSKSGTSSVGLQKGGHNTEQTTYATLGSGTVQKKNGEQHDLANVNRDLNETQIITKDQQTAGLDATVTVDHRLLSEGGRNAIKEDFEDTNNHFNHEILGGVVEGVKAGSVTAGVDAIGRKIDLRHGIAEIQTDPNSSAEQAINSVTANAEQKQEGIQELSNRLTDKAGVAEQNMLVYMDSTDPAGGMHHDQSNMSGVNAAVTDMTNGADIAKTTVHETTHHILNEQNNGYSQDTKEYAASKDGNYAQTLWEQQNRRNGNTTGGNDSGQGMATWNANHQTNDLIQKNTDHIATVPSGERENLPPLIPVAIAVGAMIASDIKVANAPAPGENLDEIPQSVSLLPTDLAAEALNELTEHKYEMAIGIAAAVGNPKRALEDGADVVNAVKGKIGKKDGVLEISSPKINSDMLAPLEPITDTSRLLPAPKRSTPELQGAPIESDIIPAGTKFNQAVSPGQKSPGAFATSENIPNKDYVRNELAVTPQFKPDISGTREVEVVRDVRVQKSTAGPQEHQGMIYKGGASQVEFLEYDPKNPFVKFTGTETSLK